MLEIDGKYYAVDDGVWFVSASPNGQWAVADSIPQEKISEIPPTSSSYNTTFVYIFESTPEVVYVGYYPGYQWSFPYYGVPVYGTGWYYPPYYRPGYYYPRYPTWGFHVGYNPWTGWNYGATWGGGFFTAGVIWGATIHGGRGCCRGWYGGGGFHGRTFVNRGDVKINIGNDVNIGNRTNIRNKIDKGDIKFDRSKQSKERNIYNRDQNRKRNAKPADARHNLKHARSSTKQRANNVFADERGNVAREKDGRWETRKDKSWKRESEASTKTKLSTSSKKKRSNMTKQNIPKTTKRTSRSTKQKFRPKTSSKSKSRKSADFGSLNRSSKKRRHGSKRVSNRPQRMKSGKRHRR